MARCDTASGGPPGQPILPRDLETPVDLTDPDTRTILGLDEEDVDPAALYQLNSGDRLFEAQIDVSAAAHQRLADSYYRALISRCPVCGLSQAGHTDQACAEKPRNAPPLRGLLTDGGLLR